MQTVVGDGLLQSFVYRNGLSTQPCGAPVLAVRGPVVSVSYVNFLLVHGEMKDS